MGIACFIGHRRINITNLLMNNLTNVIENLIINKNVNTFLFGSKSDFNDLCYKIVTNLKNKYSQIKRIMYSCKSENVFLEKDKNYWEKVLNNYSFENIQYFDEEFEFKDKYFAGKASYVERNYSMIDCSDFCIFYYDDNYVIDSKICEKLKNGSGTRLAYFYAKRKNKNIVNLCEKC